MAQRGRPRSFDREEALQRAIDVFWTLGYEGATLIDLQKAMGGIAAPSFYAAFGSKERLFREAVELYSRTLGAPMMEALAKEPTARAAIEALLGEAVKVYRKPGKPRGCLLLIGAMNPNPASKNVQNYLRGLRARRLRAIARRLKRAADAGEISVNADCPGVAAFYATVLDGLAIQARDGASRQALHFAVRRAMVAWDAVTSLTPPAPRSSTPGSGATA